MQQQSLLKVASLVLDLDLSSWMNWTAEGMKLILMIALTTMEIVTVFIVKMQE